MKADGTTDKKWAEVTAEKIRIKMSWCSRKNARKIPYTTDASGTYDDHSDPAQNWNADDGLNWWTNGFWGGILWLMAQDAGRNVAGRNYGQEVSGGDTGLVEVCRDTGETEAGWNAGQKKDDAAENSCKSTTSSTSEFYEETARYSEYRMEQCLADFYGMHHDLGFMFQPTASLDWRLTGNPRSRKIALHAASLLAGRFNPAGNFIRAWNDPEKTEDSWLKDNPDNRGWVIIDSMMNLSLLYWASEETGDPRFRNIAALHADTVQKYFIREDGSSCHIVEFDPCNGAFVRSFGGQGYAVGSSWTRGQGWAVYGFTISYKHTGNPAYLKTAQRVADYIMANLRPDGLIPIDFRQPEEPWLEDSCGASVIACGLLELADCLQKENTADSAENRLTETAEENNQKEMALPTENAHAAASAGNAQSAASAGNAHAAASTGNAQSAVSAENVHAATSAEHVKNAASAKNMQATISAEPAQKYRGAALRILHTIADSRACWDESCDTIVQGCSAAYHSSAHDITMVYADYFFIEAIWKLRGVGIFTW